jgi:hypothetical protein
MYSFLIPVKHVLKNCCKHSYRKKNDQTFKLIEKVKVIPFSKIYHVDEYKKTKDQRITSFEKISVIWFPKHFLIFPTI